MGKSELGGLGDGSMPGGRDQGIGPTGPDQEATGESRKESDMSGAASSDPRGARAIEPGKKTARINETSSERAE
jgi:hypothetical protein